MKLAFAICALGLLASCSSDENEDVRNHLVQLGKARFLSDVELTDDETVSIEVLGKHYSSSNTYDDIDQWTQNVRLELASDGQMSLIKRRNVVSAAKGEVDLSEETEVLDRRGLKGRDLAQLRQRLAIYRPEKLLPDEVTISQTNWVLPRGCLPPLSVPQKVFIRFEGSSGEVGRFTLPQNCDSESGILVKKDLRDLLSSLPNFDGFDSHLSD